MLQIFFWGLNFTYSRDERSKILESGYSDYTNRIKALKRRGGNPYLQADQTLEMRLEKKILEKTTRYKNWRKREKRW